MQPCKLYFSELGIGGWAGTAAGGGCEKERRKKKRKERVRERKKGVKSSNPSGRGKEVQGGGIGYPHHRFGNVQRCPVGSVSMQAWRFWQGQSLVARQRGGEQDSSEAHVLSFCRGICPCAVRAVHAIHAARLDKSSLAGPLASPCTSAFLQAVVAVFGGQEEMTTAMSRRKQFVAVFYTSIE